MGESHIERVNKIYRIVKKYRCGNEIARETLKSVNWDEGKAAEIISSQWIPSVESETHIKF